MAGGALTTEMESNTPTSYERICRICGGEGFVWFGELLRHESLDIVDGRPSVRFNTSRIKHVCPGCGGTGRKAVRPAAACNAADS
jgi:hypothetical protein